MKRLIELIVAAEAVLFAAPALANPIALEVFRVREVAGSHVQLTYGVDGSAGKTPQIPISAATFGRKSTAWKSPGLDFNTNTGSGIRGLKAVQMCDCSVSVGQTLAYQITVASAYDGHILTLTTPITTSGNYDAAIKDPSTIDADVMPWTIPDPPDVQGLDCAVECTDTVPSGTGGAPGPDTTDSLAGGGSCVIAQGGRSTGLVVLLLAAGLALVGRRKRG
jgi:hypothetical protein